jgi:putative NIF3 family GTP cyclohydrolase 1 type 2
VIVAYHPTLFSETKKFTMGKPLHATLLRCAAAGISVYSPHTAIDSVWGGINDWLTQGLGEGDVSLLGPPDAENLGGLGRICRLQEQVTMETLVKRIKAHLGLEQGKCFMFGPASVSLK